MRRAASPTLLLCLTLALPAGARAEGEEVGLGKNAPAAAVQHYQAGLQAYRSTEFELAARELTLAYRAYPSPGD